MAWPSTPCTGSPQTELDIPVPNPNLWSPDNPFLYGLQISTVHNGVTNDSVTSYFGMRKISINIVQRRAENIFEQPSLFWNGTAGPGFLAGWHLHRANGRRAGV